MGIAGVTVLSESIIKTVPAWTITVMMACVVISALCSNKETKTWSIIRILCLVAAIVFGTLCFLGKFTTEDVQYKCTISDDVSIADVYDSYDVTDRDGSIWILQDKERCQ